MNNIKQFARYPLDVGLLIPGGHVLDAGCLDFKFTLEMLEQGQRVVSMDADQRAFDGGVADGLDVSCLVGALVGRHIPGVWFKPGEYQEGHLEKYRSSEFDQRVWQYTITEVMEEAKVPFWSVVKLCVEGCEYGILQNWPGPIARQVCVLFHAHCLGWNPMVPKDEDEAVQRCVTRMMDCGYSPVFHKRSVRIGLPQFNNYWSSLFVLNGKSPFESQP